MRRFALQNIISMAGLAAGFVAYALSSLWTGYVNSYDNFHKDANRIYTFAIHLDGRTSVGNDWLARGGSDFYNLFRDYEDRNALDSLGIESILHYNIRNIQYNDQKSKCLYIDTAFIEYFNPVLMAGDFSFLNDPGKIAVTESFSRRAFGDDYPIGKDIDLRNDHYTVCAVIEDMSHSFISFDMLRRWEGASNTGRNMLFFKIKEGLTVKDMLDRCKNAFPSKWAGLIMRNRSVVPLKEAYKLQEDADADTFVRYDGLELLSKASLLILLCAIVNHFTFFLNYLRGRRREMSLRKVCGASAGNIAIQMIFESSTPVLVSLAVGILAVIMLKEPYLRLADIGMTDSYYLRGSVVILLVVLAISVILSLVEVVLINRRTLHTSIRQGNDKTFRRVSVGIQIASGMTLMFALIVMYHQFNYMRNLNWGTQRKDIAVIYFPKESYMTDDGRFYWGEVYMDELETRYGLKERLSALPCVSGVYLDFADMSIFHFDNGATVCKNDDCVNAQVFDYIYPGLVDRLGLTILEGAIPQEGLSDDEVVITENLFTTLGGKSLDDLHEVYISLRDSARAQKPFSIAAVVKNIHLYNFDDAPSDILLCGYHNKYLVPEYIYANERAGGSIWGELSVQFLPGTQKELESAIKRMMDDLGIEYKIEYPINSFFKHLSKDRNLSKVLLILCMISIFIALFGVFSQISLSCMERRREIAIRKTHGAKVKEILAIFGREYGTIFLISSVVAMAVGYIVMRRWIEQFYYQATISWWIYLAVFVFTALVIVATILNRVLKTARENPADVIKSE